MLGSAELPRDQAVLNAVVSTLQHFSSQSIERSGLDDVLSGALSWYEGLDRPTGLPHRAAVTPEALYPFLGTVNVIQVERSPDVRFRFRLMGTKVRDSQRQELSGKLLDEARPVAYRDLMESHYRDVLETATWRADFIRLCHRDLTGRYARLILPFSLTDPQAVDVLLTVSSWNRTYDRVYGAFVTDGSAKATGGPAA